MRDAGVAEVQPLCVYFHGCPGGPAETDWFDGVVRTAGVRVLALDRGAIARRPPTDAYVATLAGEIDALAEGTPVRLIGFSLGAFVALQAATRLKAPIAAIDLVSPAGPLGDGRILDDMAGGPLFRLAMRSAALFAAATLAQKLAVRLAPQAVVKGLFANAEGAEAELAARAEFRASVVALLVRSYGSARTAYMRDIRAYVRPWGDDLGQLRVAARIWQGGADSWAPPAMAEALAERLPGARLILLPGLGHYSALMHAVPQILRTVGEPSVLQG